MTNIILSQIFNFCKIFFINSLKFFNIFLPFLFIFPNFMIEYYKTLEGELWQKNITLLL